MDFNTALKKAKEQNRKIQLPGVTELLTPEDAETSLFRPCDVFSDEWFLEPRTVTLQEMDARNTVKYTLKQFMATSDIGRVTEEIIDNLFSEGD